MSERASAPEPYTRILWHPAINTRSYTHVPLRIFVCRGYLRRICCRRLHDLRGRIMKGVCTRRLRAQLRVCKAMKAGHATRLQQLLESSFFSLPASCSSAAIKSNERPSCAYGAQVGSSVFNTTCVSVGMEINSSLCYLFT